MRPLLKKVGLHARDQNSFRPVCNLRFMFKLLERVVQARLQAFLDSNWLMPKTQSVYGKYHSSEIAFTRLYNDPLWPGCSGRAVAYRKSPPVRHSTVHCSSPAWKSRYHVDHRSGRHAWNNEAFSLYVTVVLDINNYRNFNRPLESCRNKTYYTAHKTVALRDSS